MELLFWPKTAKFHHEGFVLFLELLCFFECLHDCLGVQEPVFSLNSRKILLCMQNQKIVFWMRVSVHSPAKVYMYQNIHSQAFAMLYAPGKCQNGYHICLRKYHYHKGRSNFIQSHFKDATVNWRSEGMLYYKELKK